MDLAHYVVIPEYVYPRLSLHSLVNPSFLHFRLSLQFRVIPALLHLHLSVQAGIYTLMYDSMEVHGLLDVHPWTTQPCDILSHVSPSEEGEKKRTYSTH